MVVVLSVVDQEDSALLLQLIDQAFAGEPVHAGGLCLQVTPSLGLVCEPDRPERRHAAGDSQLPLSVRRISRISPASLTMTTLTAGTRLLALGASGSRSSRSSAGLSADPFEKR